MNLRDLMTKLDTLAEADDPRAQYDKFKADDARTAAIAQVKKMMATPLSDIPRLGDAIDPKTGMIYYGAATRENGAPEATPYPYKWLASSTPGSEAKKLLDILTPAGLKVIPIEKKQLFGSTQIAGISPQQLADIDKPQPVVGPAPAPSPAPAPGPNGKLPGQNKGPQDDIAKLDALTKALEDSLKGQGPMPSPVTPTVVVPKEKEKTLGQKAGIGAGIAAGGLTGAALGKKYGGKFGAVAGGLAGGALGGLGVNALQKDEGVEYNSSIAQALTESFGYDFEDEQLDEYSLDQFGKDAGDFGRGAWNGVTLGTGDNIAAGVQSAFGKDTYKQALAKQTAASKEAETRSPWLYGAGNVAGSIAVPVPGGAIAGGLIKGASTAAKIGRGATALGANLAAQQGVDMVKNASDTKTLGYDPTKYPTTPQAIMAFQKANGLTADGKIGPKTQAVLAKMGLTPQTVAESIKSLQDKLAIIESGQWRLEEDNVYHVWLLDDNTVVGQNGESITDDVVLESIEWNPQFLAELELPGSKLIGKGISGAKELGSKALNYFTGAGEKKAAQTVAKDVTAVKPTTTPAGTVYKRKVDSPNIAAEVPYVQGRAGTGPNATQFAKFDPASSAVARADQGIGNMVSGGVKAAEKEAGAAGKVIGAAEKEAGAAGKVIGAAEKEAGAVEKGAATALTDAEKAAAAVEAKEASRLGKLKNWIKTNPLKAAALGLAAAGAVGAGVAALDGDEETPTDTTGGGGAGAETGTTTGGTTPADTTGGGKLTPEQEALIKQIEELMGHEWGDDKDWMKATGHARVVLDKATKASPEQLAADAKNDAGAPATGTAGTTSSGGAAAPTGTTTLNVPKVPAGTVISKESADNELARWLKIARG
jgi:hypothetical protein